MRSFHAIVSILQITACCLPSQSPAQIPPGQDTIRIAGDSFHGRENAGLMEATINGDTTVGGMRINPDRVYALNEGQYYHQLAPINVVNPTGTLAIVGVPSDHGKTKPVILITNAGEAHVVINANGTNQVYGSLKFDNIHYQAMELGGYQPAELFYCGTAQQLPQSLTINNSLFEFCNVDLFDCTNESGSIGGWPFGAKFRITNSYFRNMFHPGQWWGSRIFQCKHVIDTIWVENCTVTNGGMTFLQQNQLTEFAYFNHNTFVNNKKYWLNSPYYHNLFITQNLFINQNWVGEDTNIIVYRLDRQLKSTIDVDSITAWAGVLVPSRYVAPDGYHYSPELDLANLRVFVSDNITYYDPLLINGYYQSAKYKDPSIGALPSYLTWFGFSNPPFPVRDVPGEWMNTRTQSFFTSYGPPNGGFVEKRTSTADPHTETPGIVDESVVDSMAVWNQYQWGDPRFPTPSAITNSKFVFGDYNPTTLPGLANGIKTDQDTSDGAGITKFTDLTESFRQSNIISAIDGLPVGSLIWNDAPMAAYNSEQDWRSVYTNYVMTPGLHVEALSSNAPVNYHLAQNYPNPFNASTTIRYDLPRQTQVSIKVYNVLGQEVHRLIDGDVKSAGRYQVDFSARSLSSGTYYYRIEAGDFLEVKRMILLR